MRYLSIVSVLPSVDGGWRCQLGKAAQSTGMEAKQCTTVDGDSSKNSKSLSV